MVRKNLCCGVVATVVGLAGCASHDVLHERGWIGGRYADAGDVVRAGPGGALIIGSWDGTPAAAAGLVPGDLVTAVDGAPVGSAADLRTAFRERTPGGTAAVQFRRDGEEHTAPVVVGRETWKRVGTIRLGLSFSPKFDIWPFDDGIDLLGIVAFRVHRPDPDLAGPEARLARTADPAGPAPTAAGDGWDVWLAVIGVGSREEIVSENR
ncbi:MAG: PDZ domain-containing protein [Planctomycetes bacterium]|nr:PDZ domain-containing protein [Planctomycetota bacterium]